MKKAMITGSFDPITVGHIDLIRRAALLFDEVYVVVFANTEKKSGMFTPDERLLLCKAAIGGLNLNGVSAVKFDGLTSDIARALGVSCLVRGARSGSDFDYEYELANIMRRFDGELETIVLPAAPELSMISSTYARDLIRYGCDLTGAVPTACIPLIQEILEGAKK